MSLDIGLLKESFAAIRPHALEVVEHFYGELFSRYPEAEGLFNMRKMAEQRKALAGSLAFIVDNVDKPDALVPYLRKMGGRHVAYGTKPEHFEWVGAALLATLEYYFDAQWTASLRETWTAAFTFIAAEMKTGMEEQEEGKSMETRKDAPAPGPSEPTINEFAQKLAQELFRKAIEEEISSPAFQSALKRKVQEILRKAVENEATHMLAEARARARAA